MRRLLASAAVLLLSAAAVVGCGPGPHGGRFHGPHSPGRGGHAHGWHGHNHGFWHGHGGHGWGVGKLLFFALQVWAVVDVLRRADLKREHQALWALGILFVPVLGVLAYVVVGRPTRPSSV